MVAALLMSACSGSRELLDANTARTMDSPGIVTVEGTLSARDGQEVRLCRDARLGAAVFTCPDGSLVVRGVDFERVPRLERTGDTRLAWPPIVLEGRLAAGVLEVTAMPVVYLVTVVEPDDGSVRVDQSGSGRPVQLTPGQEIGLQQERLSDLSPRRVKGSGGGSLYLETLPCPPGASCMGGYVTVTTADLAEGLYSFTEQGVRVTLRAEIDYRTGT